MKVYDFDGNRVLTLGGGYDGAAMVREWIIADKGDGYLTQYIIDNNIG